MNREPRWIYLRRNCVKSLFTHIRGVPAQLTSSGELELTELADDGTRRAASGKEATRSLARLRNTVLPAIKLNDKTGTQSYAWLDEND